MVLLPKLNNSNPGTAHLLGGDSWDKLADYFNDIDTSEVPRINTPTEFRSGIAKIRDGSNAFNVVIKSATQTANRDFTIPALTGNDSPGMLGLQNNWTAINQIQVDTDTLLNLYRPVNTTNTFCGLGFYERNSSNAPIAYAAIYNKLIVNTAGDEDGKLVFYVRKDGVLTEVGSIDKNGLLTIGSLSTGGGTPSAILADANVFTNINTISSDNQRLLKLYRPTNTVNNIVGLEFDHKNAAGTQIEYGRIVTQLIANTTGDEDGKMLFSVMKDGTLTQVMSVDKNGLLTVNSISTGGGGTGVTVLKNTGVITTTASSTSEFDLLNYSLPANTLGTNGAIKVRLSGHILQNQATGTDFIWKIKFGGTTITQDTVAAVTQSAINRPFLLEFVLGNNNATNVQGCTGMFMQQDSTAATTGEGSLNDDEQIGSGAFRSVPGSKDTTSAQTLQVTMTMSISNAAVTTTVQRQIIEFYPGV